MQAKTEIYGPLTRADCIRYGSWVYTSHSFESTSRPLAAGTALRTSFPGEIYVSDAQRKKYLSFYDTNFSTLFVVLINLQIVCSIRKVMIKITGNFHKITSCDEILK